MSYLDIIRRMEQSKEPKPDPLQAEGPDAAPLTKKEKSPPAPEPPGIRVELALVPWPICWESADGTLKGPALVEVLAEADGEYWVCVSWRGTITWLRQDLIRARPTRLGGTA